MMEDVLKIEWYTGYMELYLPNFFPCSVRAFKQLMRRVVGVALNRDYVLEKLRTYIQKMDDRETDKKRKYTYSDCLAVLDKYERKWR